ncbi:hypothetical protein P7228_04425 [Altererythrobacter arenosus]|uniref:DUF2059 domain-containing protein n=1 Tax=Altererythrobacter arenosus TaxID=3032592 RepID=A0ABY8FY64_9SPHN|nr:hypothetical protein [Altererythrobacter sp. CAU 1644]WFL78316.1 hypothetical protein P7228_04425 [Altererythrobacter sp. CAU 1644]
MRPIKLAAAASAIALASPAALAAQEVEPVEEVPVQSLTEKLADPAEQERLAGMVEAMSHVLLSVRVAPLMEAMAEATGEDPADVHPETTLGEIAGPRAEELPGVIAERLPQAMGMMAGMAKSLEALRPMLKSLSETMSEELARLPDS